MFVNSLRNRTAFCGAVGSASCVVVSDCAPSCENIEILAGTVLAVSVFFYAAIRLSNLAAFYSFIIIISIIMMHISTREKQNELSAG